MAIQIVRTFSLTADIDERLRRFSREEGINGSKAAREGLLLLFAAYERKRRKADVQGDERETDPPAREWEVS